MNADDHPYRAPGGVPVREPLRLTDEDLFSPGVEAYLEERRTSGGVVAEVEPLSAWARLRYTNWIHLSLAGGIGGFVAWLILEPRISDSLVARTGGQAFERLLFAIVAGSVGLFLGAVEGLLGRNPVRAALCGAVGLGVGLGGGLVAGIAADVLFVLALTVAVQFIPNPAAAVRPTGLALVIVMMGRALAWAVAAVPAGLGQGIALRSRKLALNGLLGAVLGGLLGGLFFDPIEYLLARPDGEAAASRGVGFVVIGLMVGLFVGLVEQWTKTAWVLIRSGPLAGKQFILHRARTVLGSSPGSDLYLFKDAVIEPRHALIHQRGGRYEVEDLDTPGGTLVNGVSVGRHLLRAGDRMVLGSTVLEFSVRDSG